MQYRPASILPSTGTLLVAITGDPVAITCPNLRVDVRLTSLTVSISTVQVHRTGGLDQTGELITVPNSARTIDLLLIRNTQELLGSVNLPEGTITSVRLSVTSAVASSGTGPLHVLVPSGSLEASLTPNGQVRSGMTTSVVVEPHVVCEGNGTLRLTPVLTATSRSSQ